ncbi:hypothetical protein IJG26_01900 [Candidatus Saccharibacteria bacterium]|nr:hypothetical protein [Candidatus Saccharibacteria bacterium]
MSEVLKNHSEENNLDSSAWDSLSEVSFSEKNEYTNDERKTIVRYERRLMEDREDYERALERLKQSERRGEDYYEQAEKFYFMDGWRSIVESDKQALKNLREHKSAFETKEKLEEKDYIPKEALEILDSIPDSSGFNELKKRVKNAYYSVNIQYDEASEELSKVMGRRKEYLNENGFPLDDSGENDFWFMKKLELSRAKEFNEKQADRFLSTAKRFAGCKEEPESLQYTLYQDDGRWKLEHYR